MTPDISKELQEFLITISLRIAKRNEGTLFVVGKVSYKSLVEQSVPSFDIMKNPKLLESLALIDGAVIISHEGKLEAYGAMTKNNKVYQNFGTRHSAAISASKKDKENLVVLVSEEDKKVRIFRNGKMLMQIDADKKGIEKSVPEAVNIMESIGAGTIGAIGTSLLAPALGIALLPGIVIFGTVYYVSRNIHKRLSGKRALPK